MTDTAPQPPWDSELCGPCYWGAVGLELSCDWLPEETAP